MNKGQRGKQESQKDEQRENENQSKIGEHAPPVSRLADIDNVLRILRRAIHAL